LVLASSTSNNILTSSFLSYCVRDSTSASHVTWGKSPKPTQTPNNLYTEATDNHNMTKVSIIIGSKSDTGLGEKAALTLQEFNVPHELKVISAHRNPERLASYVKNSDADVYICVAGLAAALPGTVAAQTVKPVIGVPRDVKLGGLDSLLSIVQMPPGIPVATVAIDGAVNAALLAVEMLAISDERLEAMLHEYREKQAKG